MKSGKPYILQSKEIAKTVYDNVFNSTKLQNTMNTIFVNSGNSKTFYPHRVFLNL